MFRIHKPDPGPERLGDVLARLFVARGWGRRSARAQLEAAWANAIDDAQRPHTRVLLLRRGVLEVEVNDAVLLQELASFGRRTLLAKMKQILPSAVLREIRFKSGTW